MIIFKTKNPDEVQKLLDKKIKAKEVINGESIYELEEDIQLDKILTVSAEVTAPAEISGSNKDTEKDTPKAEKKPGRKKKNK